MAVLPLSTFALFDGKVIEKMEPYCWINGITITKDNFTDYYSDYSIRSIPKAYDGECREYPVLSSTEKKRIHTIIYTAFSPYMWEEFKYGEDRDEITDEVIQNQLFGILQKMVGSEHSKWKEKANLEKMAKISFIVTLFRKDDYYLEKPTK